MSYYACDSLKGCRGARLRDITVPAGCPESLLFVPESVRTSVLQWGHSSSLACHPGATRTHRLIKQRFWWPSMARDARWFVSACPICAAGKGSNRTIILELTMFEYAHNSLPVSSTGLSLFQRCLGYQPPLFPSQESNAVVPSAHAFIQRCRRTWRIAREALTRTGERNKVSADRHRTKPPLYVCGQKVWLSSKDINFRLSARKLGPKFIGPFIVAKVLSR